MYVYMKYFYILISIIFLSVGCTKSSEVKTVTTPNGYVYKFIKKGKVIGDNQKEIDIWERIVPPDTNNWYYPPLQSMSNTNVPMTFISTPR